MIKIAALNEESDEDSDTGDEVTKEALEQIALQQYGKALELQRKGEIKEAMQLLKDLLDTELLYEVKKPAPGEKTNNPLFNLKYLCYKNVGAMQSSVEELEASIDSYNAASALDDTDVTLWHRLGLVCMKAKRYEEALRAFHRGVERNPRHWPCLDKIVTLLYALGFYEDCVAVIHKTLLLDPGYFRGLVYRNTIFKNHPFVRDYMEYLNKKFVLTNDDEQLNEEKSAQLLKEADTITAELEEQRNADHFESVLPLLKLRKPISGLTWVSLGESLVDMHKYMTDNCYSHACFIELVYQAADQEEQMEVCEDFKKTDSTESRSDENNTDGEKIFENGSENENNDLSDKEKVQTDNEKVESDVEMIGTENSDPQQVQNKNKEQNNTDTSTKEQKKVSVRRRGNDLSSLTVWEWWCKPRKSGRKKQRVQEDTNNIYDTLRKLVPLNLVPKVVEKNENEKRESSPDIGDLDKLFDTKEECEDYFGKEQEKKDVEKFIASYSENRRDIIQLLQDYIGILSTKWKLKWPELLPQIYVDANDCYNNHVDVPSCANANHVQIVHYVNVNILSEEFKVHFKSESGTSEKNNNFHDLSVCESINQILNSKPDLFGTECLELMLRYLWVKTHVHILHKDDEFALDCLYQLLCQFKSMGEHSDYYKLYMTNFKFKSIISKAEIINYIDFLERNKRLSFVNDLYEREEHEEVIAILLDSFQHNNDISKEQEESMALNFSVQLSMILDSYWALGKVEECFKRSFICLHEALKYFFRYTSGCKDYENWSIAVVKILSSIEHIINTEGLSCFDYISPKILSQGLEDLIRIIGHQVETNASEMPFDTVIPWFIMHYIIQREEDEGRGATMLEKGKEYCYEVPDALMVLFLGHQQLGNRSWCKKNECKMLYFILDKVTPILRTPFLKKSLETIMQHMEQVVYCLYGYSKVKINKIKYIENHNVNTEQNLDDWLRAQQVYEIIRPLTLPELAGKITAITAETEVIFQRILALLPEEYDLKKYVPDLEHFMSGKETKMPKVPFAFPFKMKDIFLFLGDYYFKRDDYKMSLKYNLYDVLINPDRSESWSQISLEKQVLLERNLSTCDNLNNERDVMRPAKTVIRCFKKALSLGTDTLVKVEYGAFAYKVNSFCSRLLKQASESLSMEDFELLEKQKDEMLDTAEKCFVKVVEKLKNSQDLDDVHSNLWVSLYYLGKIAEKRNKHPSVYTDFYMKSIKSLHEADAIYPSKINYNSPQRYSMEVHELHYRIHASILKYMEQHENKPVPVAVGKIFINCIEEWKNGPFSKKAKKTTATTTTDQNEATAVKPTEDTPHAANILKRSISDAGEEDTHEVKKMKLEAAAAKVRRSASYDTERLASKDATPNSTENNSISTTPITEKLTSIEEKKDMPETNGEVKLVIEQVNTQEKQEVQENVNGTSKIAAEKNQETDSEKREESSSSTSSSESSSSDSSSDSTSDSCQDSDTTSKSSNESKMLTDDEIMRIIFDCLNALEECVSRFSLHYKSLYRMAHYHFYYKKGRDLERCRDIMLTNFTSKRGSKLVGLFGERKNANLFNNIWRVPLHDIDRADGFFVHMNRCVLLTLEILKEIDDNTTLLEISLQLQKTPDLDKKYLKDSDREELSQQAFSLCLQSLKAQLVKFSQQPDLKTNEVEKTAFNFFMYDIYKAYKTLPRHFGAKQCLNLLIDCYKLVHNVTENMNLVDLTLKYCVALKQTLNEKSQNVQKKQPQKPVEVPKILSTPTTTVSKLDQLPAPTTTSQQKMPQPPAAPKLSTTAANLASMLPLFMDNNLYPKNSNAFALSQLNQISATYKAFSDFLHTNYPNSFPADFGSQFSRQASFGSYAPPQKKKRGPKPHASKSAILPSTMMGGMNCLPFNNPSKSSSSAVNYPKTSTVMKNLTKHTSSTLAPSMGTVLPTLPASMSIGLTQSYAQSSQQGARNSPSASSSVGNVPSNLLQTSPGKTLQEKLAERQKITKSNSAHEINASLGRLPSSLTITKSSLPKPPAAKPKKTSEVKKSLSFNDKVRSVPKPALSNEVIVLDDDDD